MGPGIEPLPGKEKAVAPVAKQQAGGGMASQFPEFEALSGGGPSGGPSDGIEPLGEDVVNTLVKDCASILGALEEEVCAERACSGSVLSVSIMS